MTLPYLLAAATALVSFLVHWLVGGRYAARPLLADNSLPRASKWLNYMCWHIVTVLLLGMAFALLLAGLGAAHEQVALSAGIMASAISAVSIGVTLHAGIRPWRFPASYLLGSVALLTLWGWLS